MFHLLSKVLLWKFYFEELYNFFKNIRNFIRAVKSNYTDILSWEAYVDSWLENIAKHCDILVKG